MELALRGIVVVVGNCGSGKTEVSVNLAIDQTAKGSLVKVADLDLVNPYFRAREVRKFLSAHGVQIALPPEQYLHADLPILTPVISGMIKNTPELLILDVGGGGIGSTVLGALSCFFKDKTVQMMYVVNPYRPHTDTIENCLKMRDEIEASAKIKITGIIGNTNLMSETTIGNIYDGYDFILRLSEYSGIPISCITVPVMRMSSLNQDDFDCPVLPISRQLVPPWLSPELIKNDNV